MPDPRLGYRENDGDITTTPTQFADGSTYAGGPASKFFFNNNDFTLLPPGYATLGAISSTLQSELTALLGSSGIIGSLSTTRDTLGVSTIAPVTVFDEFLGSTLSTDNWNVDASGTGSAVSQPNTSGFSVVTLNTGTADNGFGVLASDLSFNSSSNLLMLEARVRIDDIADVNLEFGFSDAQTETNGLAFSALATVTAVATNGVMFAYHNETSGEVNTGWRTARVNAGSANSAAITSSGSPIAVSVNTWINLSVVLAKNGSNVDASWFINDVQVATATSAVAANIPLYVWVSAKTYEAADAKTFDIDYLRVVQSR